MSTTIMDCWEALELHEGIDAGAIPADDPLAVQARQHLDSCRNCQTALPNRRKWHGELATAMADLAVPADLESRIALQLAPLPAERGTVIAKPVRTRRWWVAALVTSAALVLFLVWQQPWTAAESLISRQVVEASIGCDLSELAPYTSDRWQPVLPSAWQAFFELRPELVRAFPPEQTGLRSAAALVPFEFHHSSLAKPIRGRLVVVPLPRYRSPPIAKDFFLAQVEYVAGFDCCLWTEGNFVYLCFVRSVNGGEMHELQRLMRESRNFT